MRTSQFFSYLVMIVLSFLNCEIRGQDSKAEIYETLAVSVKLKHATFSSKASIFQGVTRVEPLECGKKYRIKLTVENVSDRDFTFERIGTSCQCGSIKLKQNVIPANGMISGEAFWTVPSSSTSGNGLIVASLYNKSERIGEIRLLAYLRGNFYVGRETAGQRITSGLLEWRVPLLVSTPLSFDGLQASLSEQMDGFTVVLEKSGELKSSMKKTSDPKSLDPTADPTVEQGWAIIHAHESMVGNEYRFGQLVLTHKDTRKRNKHDLALYARPPVRVSPMKLEFRMAGNGNSRLYARVLVQLDRKFFEARRRQDSESAVHDGKPSRRATDAKRKAQATGEGASNQPISFEVKLKLGGNAVKVNGVHLGKTVYRIEVWPKQELFDDSEKLEGNWTITADGQTFDIPVSAIRR